MIKVIHASAVETEVIHQRPVSILRNLQPKPDYTGHIKNDSGISKVNIPSTLWLSNEATERPMRQEQTMRFYHCYSVEFVSRGDTHCAAAFSFEVFLCTGRKATRVKQKKLRSEIILPTMCCQNNWCTWKKKEEPKHSHILWINKNCLWSGSENTTVT